MKNIYGGKSGAFFLEVVFEFLLGHGFKQAEGDQCLLHKINDNNTYTLVSLSSDDHLVTGSTNWNIDEYHTRLASRYETKRLCFPEKFIGWHFSKLPTSSHGT